MWDLAGPVALAATGFGSLTKDVASKLGAKQGIWNQMLCETETGSIFEPEFENDVWENKIETATKQN